MIGLAYLPEIERIELGFDQEVRTPPVMLSQYQASKAI